VAPHFCLEGADLARAAGARRTAGPPLPVEPKPGLDNNRQCWIEDPDGNRIEFMQMAPDAMQLAAIRRIHQRM